jgi:hypothetical protein
MLIETAAMAIRTISFDDPDWAPAAKRLAINNEIFN